MKLTEKQITAIEKKLKIAEFLEAKAQQAAQKLCIEIEKSTGISGFVDHLQGDGFGFTSESNDDVHIPIAELLRLAKKGEDITDELLEDNYSI